MQAIIKWTKANVLGILLAVILAAIGMLLSSFVPYGLISGGVFALLIGMCLNPLVTKNKQQLGSGVNFASKKLLKTAIVLMGVTLSFAQVVEVGKFSLIVMSFTLVAAFGFGWLFGRLFRMNWKLSSLISAGTGICGGSAIAAISPVIEAKDSDVAYAISATFLFDILMVILFPIAARAMGMSDLGFGLWAGTAVNDTSSVVAAGYAFSDIAGNFAVIVKLTRTLSIIPIVVIFSIINQRIKLKERIALLSSTPATDNTDNSAAAIAIHSVNPNNCNSNNSACTVANCNSNNLACTVANYEENNSACTAANYEENNSACTAARATTTITTQPHSSATSKIKWSKIFPFFIIFFLIVVGIKSTGILPQFLCDTIATFSKFFMVMALGAIGLKTNFKSVAKSGFKPMLHGFIISTLVVFVALGVQILIGQF